METSIATQLRNNYQTMAAFGGDSCPVRSEPRFQEINSSLRAFGGSLGNCPVLNKTENIQQPIVRCPYHKTN